MPPELYVQHDDAMLNQVTSWLLEGQHIAVTSPHGTGKSALREIVERDLGDREDFAVAALDNPASTTERGVYERVLRAAARAGYEIDPDDYWQVKDGIPWSTQETEQAVAEVATQARGDDTTLLLVVDECEDLDPELAGPLQTAADAGVRLLLLGTPDARAHLETVRETLDARLRYYDGIDPFDAEAVAEYVGRSLAAFRGEAYDGASAGLFSGDAIRFVLEESGGNPRQVRMACLDLFTRAAFLWQQVDVDIERVTVTSALADRDLELDEGPLREA
jgi:type II secretory pathway predicted ATPase ExeA